MLTLLIILVSQLFVLAQNTTQQDSLERVLQSPVHDTTKIAAALGLNRLLRSTDADRTRAILHFADSLAHLHQRDADIIRVRSGLGILEAIQGNYHEAIQWMEQALQKAREDNLPNMIAENYVNLGIINRRIGNYTASQEYYLQAITLYDQLEDLEGLSSTYENLGVVTDLIGDYDAAMEYYEKSLAMEKQLNRGKSLASLYNNMAIVEQGRGNLSLAVDMLKEALLINKEQGNTTGIVANYMNIGNFLSEQGAHKEALPFFDSARVILEHSHDKFSQVNLAYNYGETYLQLNQTNRSLPFALSSLQLAEDIQSFHSLTEAHNLLSRIYERKQDYPKALHHYQRYSMYKDSLFNEGKKRELANYQVQLDVFTKNKRIADQEIEMLRVNQQLLRERRLLFLVGVIALLALLVGYLFVQKFIQSKRTRQQLEKQNALIQQQKETIESINQQLEMRLLRAQLNPHFIFNALSSIQHLIAGNDKTSALNYLGKFSRLLRQVLDNASETTVVLAEEIKLLKAYIELEALRFNQDFTYEIHLSDEIDPEDTELPVLLLQPLIENAILHGLLPSKNAKKLSLSFSLADGNLCCVVEDNGVGRNQLKPSDTAVQIKHKSHGIHITRQRLANRIESDVQTIQYEDLKNDEGQAAGTRVTVHIPSSY